MDNKFKQKGFAIRVRVNIDGDAKLVRLSGPVVWCAVLYMLSGIASGAVLLSLL
jgi:hypothetical protein